MVRRMGAVCQHGTAPQRRGLMHSRVRIKIFSIEPQTEGFVPENLSCREQVVLAIMQR
jgi:hypothetical protein